jgi:AbrB family looped-hinge helix DNA binding protein
MANVVGERYQITIDKVVRRQLGIKPGDRAVEQVIDGRLVVDFIPATHAESLHGIFRRPDSPPSGDWQATKERAWEMRTAELREVLQADTDRHREDD